MIIMNWLQYENSCIYVSWLYMAPRKPPNTVLKMIIPAKEKSLYILPNAVYTLTFTIFVSASWIIDTRVPTPRYDNILKIGLKHNFHL